MLTASKSSLTALNGEPFQVKTELEKYFEGEILIRTLATTPLQIFFKIILDTEVIIKSMIDPDDNFASKNSQAWMD